MTVEPDMEMTLVLPCLNEELTLQKCIEDARYWAREAGLTLQIIVADNGSVDNSFEIARRFSDLVIRVSQRGYGAALDAGIRAAKNDLVIIADSDLSYDLSQIEEFRTKLVYEKYDLVLGNRFRGGIEPRAMPWHHRYIGNPALSMIGRLLFTNSVKDFHCGIRSFKKAAYLECGSFSSGMEFASEMVIKFAGVGKSITEIPVRLSRDGRNRKPHLRSFRDGFRHLKLMIAMSPQFVLLLPGFLISVVSFFATGLTLIGITELSESNLVYQIVALDFGLIMICFGAIAIAHRKSQGINRFKWSLIQFSKKREIFAIAAPILMILASLFVANTESNFDRQIMYLISYVLLLGAFQLLMAALIVRQILSPIWKKD